MIVAANEGGGGRRGRIAAPEVGHPGRQAVTGRSSEDTTPAQPCRRVRTVQVLSIVCNADFSDDCNLRLQVYLVRIHILAYVHR